ncbi:MAG: DsbA family protein [Rhodothermales bacterium]
MKKRYIASSVVQSFFLTCIFATAYADQGMSQERVLASTQAEITDDLGEEYKKLIRIVESKKAAVQTIDGSLNIADRPGMGPKDSEVILVEFGDFQCPFCKRHLKGTAQEIHQRLILKNQLRYVFLDYPMEAKHPFAIKAAIAARCAEEQGRYWEMRNALFNNQKALHEFFLVEHAKNAGMDDVEFNNCLQSGRYITAIRQDQIVGKSLGIKGTPTFFIGINKGDKIQMLRKIQGAQSYEVFEKEILQAIELAKSYRGELTKTNLSSY